MNTLIFSDRFRDIGDLIWIWWQILYPRIGWAHTQYQELLTIFVSSLVMAFPRLFNMMMAIVFTISFPKWHVYAVVVVVFSLKNNHWIFISGGMDRYSRYRYRYHYRFSCILLYVFSGFSGKVITTQSTNRKASSNIPLTDAISDVISLVPSKD